MPEAKFVLKEPKSTDNTLVYLFYNFNQKRLKYSTQEKILPKYWNEESQRARETKSFPEYAEFNSRLKNIQTSVNNVYRRLLNNGQLITPELLKSELNIELDRDKRAEKLTLFQFIEKYIKESASLKKIATIKTYTTTFNHVKEYATKRKFTLDFENIDMQFHSDYANYLMNDLNLSTNTIGKNLKTFKVFLNEATERGINTNLDFKKKKFRYISEKTEKIYLTKDEIKLIYDQDLSKKLSYDRVRDLFIIGCYTGLRFSDYGQIKQENIFDGNKLKIRTIKTDEVVVIPLHPIVKDIFKKYEGVLPKVISAQKINEYLKEIAKDAKLEEIIETSITKGGKRITSYSAKSQLVSTHTARRSFATNAYLAGVPSIQIMKITGHRTESMFMRYIKISQEENANNLLNHPFFA